MKPLYFSLFPRGSSEFFIGIVGLFDDFLADDGLNDGSAQKGLNPQLQKQSAHSRDFAGETQSANHLQGLNRFLQRSVVGFVDVGELKNLLHVQHLQPKDQSVERHVLYFRSLIGSERLHFGLRVESEAKAF